jgi:hypothetical protein
LIHNSLNSGVPGQIIFSVRDGEVQPTLTSIVVRPSPVKLAAGATQQFAATGYDQSGNALAAQLTFTWTAAAGTIGPSGLWTAPGTSGIFSVTATSGAISGTANVTVFNQTQPKPNPGPKPTPSPTRDPSPTPASGLAPAPPTPTAATKPALLATGASGGIPNPGDKHLPAPLAEPETPNSSAGRYGAGGSNLQEAMLLALNDLTIASTSVFDVGDLPAEPAPPQKVDAPDDLPPRVYVTVKPVVSPNKSDAPLPSSHHPWIVLLWATALIAVAGYVWWRCFVRPHRRLLDQWLFPPVPIEDLPDDDARPSPGGLPREESEHANRG